MTLTNQVVPQPCSLAPSSLLHTLLHTILACMVHCSACTSTRCRHSFLQSDNVEFISILLSIISHASTATRILNRRLAVRLNFLRRPAILPTVLGVPPAPMTIHSVPWHTYNTFGVMPQQPVFGVPPTPNTSKPPSPPSLRRHLCLGDLPPLPTCHQFSRTAPYSNFSLFI